MNDVSQCDHLIDTRMIDSLEFAQWLQTYEFDCTMKMRPGKQSSWSLTSLYGYTEPRTGETSLSTLTFNHENTCPQGPDYQSSDWPETRQRRQRRPRKCSAWHQREWIAPAWGPEPARHRTSSPALVSESISSCWLCAAGLWSPCLFYLNWIVMDELLAC